MKPVARQLHRSGSDRTQPEVSARVFVKGGNLLKAQAIPARVRMKPAALFVAIGEKLDESFVSRNPEPAV